MSLNIGGAITETAKDVREIRDSARESASDEPNLVRQTGWRYPLNDNLTAFQVQKPSVTPTSFLSDD